jgi:predicted DNA-binding transcriptional regulator AlpA
MPIPSESTRRLPVEAAASYTGLSVSTLNKLRVFGGGPVFLKLGRRVAYDVADLDAWLANKRRTSTSDDGSWSGQ